MKKFEIIAILILVTLRLLQIVITLLFDIEIPLASYYFNKILYFGLAYFLIRYLYSGNKKQVN